MDGCCILLVDDHVDTLHIAERLLRSWGHTVHRAENVATATRIFLAEPIALIVTDIGLPDGDGCEFFTRARSIRPVRGIALTAYGMSSDIEKCRTAGFGQHLLKPVQVHALKAAIDTECRALSVSTSESASR